MTRPLRARLVLVAGGLAAALLFLSARGVAEKPVAVVPAGPPARVAGNVPTIAVSEVKEGMRGYGLTVFHGTEPERFDVRVIGVLRRFLPKQDIILISSDDARLMHSGIVAGMSGSPIYIEGRLAGALAYGWPFAKDPIAGVTPIENMQKELERPLRGVRTTPLAARDEAAPALAQLGLPPPLPTTIDRGGTQLVRAMVPLSLSGMTARSVDELTQLFAPYHLIPLQAGGAASTHAPLRSYSDGAAMAVQLFRGDMSGAITGTVTEVRGERLLGFGHPMLNAGEIYLPMATAEVHTFMSSLSSSFKLSSPISEAGALVQDRQSGVIGDVRQHADMIPVDVQITVGNAAPQTFHVQVARHRYLTPVLVGNILSNAVNAAASDIADAVVDVRARIGVRGQRVLELRDELYAPDGASGRNLSGTTSVRALVEILFNPFVQVQLDTVRFEVQVGYKPEVAEIVAIAVGQEELEPGGRANLYVTLRPFGGKEQQRTVAFDVPRHLAGQFLKISAVAGNNARPEIAPAESLPQILDNLGKSYSGRSLVVMLESADEGVNLRGGVIPDLPGSVIDTLRPSSSTRRGEVFKRALRVVLPTEHVITGQKELTLRVREER